MAETPDVRDDLDLRPAGVGLDVADADLWFVGEVLPLEAALMQFLLHNWRNKSDIEDLLQDIYVRVYEAALKQIPESTKPFVFTTARNLLINRVRRERIIPIEAVAEWETLNVAKDEPGADRVLMARDELARLQVTLDRLPPRCREAILLRRVEGLSRREIAARMGISEYTVAEYLTRGMCALADILYGEPADLGRKS
jgi:RNA polymerase sigma factor (sigma-70 family)